MLEHRIDRGHAERERRCADGSQAVRLAVADRNLRLERRVATEQHRIIQRDAVVEDSAVQLQDGLRVHGIRHTQPRFDRVVVGVGEAARGADEERVHSRVVVHDEIARRAREPVARQYDAVITRTRGDPPGRRIDHGLIRRAVVCRVEGRGVVVEPVERWPEHPAKATLDRDVVGRSPGVLDEHVRRRRTPLGQGALADFSIAREHSERGVRYPGARAERTGRRIRELEPAVLVVRASGDRLDVDLIEVVLTGVFERHAGLERMPAAQVRGRVVEGVDRTTRRGRIWPTVDLAEGVDADRGDLVRDLLVVGEQVRIIDAVLAALEQISAPEDLDEYLVQRVGEAELVDQIALDRAGPARRLGGVRPVPVRPGIGECAAERVDGLPVVLASTGS